MRKSHLLIVVLFLLTGCATNQSDAAGANLTIFGRLSQIIQLGSTEETIAYKLQTDDLFITIRGEVLMNRPAALNMSLTDRETGAVRNDVTLAVHLCQVFDEEIYGVDSCTEFDGELYEHTLTATLVDDVYYVEGFEWDRSGGFTGSLMIGMADSAETDTLTFKSQIYPARPPSTNTFELVSISLPFIAIGLFLMVVRLRQGRLMQPVVA